MSGFRLVVGVLLTVVLSSAAFAQSARATGTVKDTNGRPIKGAIVRADQSRRLAIRDHLDDRRQRPLGDDRPENGHVEVRRRGARVHSRSRQTPRFVSRAPRRWASRSRTIPDRFRVRSTRTSSSWSPSQCAARSWSIRSGADRLSADPRAESEADVALVRRRRRLPTAGLDQTDPAARRALLDRAITDVQSVAERRSDQRACEGRARVNALRAAGASALTMPARVRVPARRWRAALIIALFFVAVAGSAAVGWWYARESPPHQGPILLVSIDGVPATDLPAYGAQRTDTPAIDALASESVVFDRAYTHSPQSLPAHASLLTGRLPIDHGVRDDAGFSLAAGHEHAGRTAAKPWVHDRRGGVVVPAAAAHRNQPGVLVLRRRDAIGRVGGTCRNRARRRADHRRRRALDVDTGRPAILPVRAGSRGGRRRSRHAAVGRAEGAWTLRRRDDRARRRSRRRRLGPHARRSRAARALHRQAAGQPGQSPPRPLSGAERRPAADDSRPGSRTTTGRPSRAIAARSPRRRRDGDVRSRRSTQNRWRRISGSEERLSTRSPGTISASCAAQARIWFRSKRARRRSAKRRRPHDFERSSMVFSARRRLRPERPSRRVKRTATRCSDTWASPGPLLRSMLPLTHKPSERSSSSTAPRPCSSGRRNTRREYEPSRRSRGRTRHSSRFISRSACCSRGPAESKKRFSSSARSASFGPMHHRRRWAWPTRC